MPEAGESLEAGRLLEVRELLGVREAMVVGKEVRELLEVGVLGLSLQPS